MAKEIKTKKELIKQIIIYAMMISCLVLMIVFSIQKKTPVIKLIPCCITIIVQFFNSKANRFAKLIGGTNCILYSIGYLMDGLWGSFLNALLISSTIQYITFIRWSKNKYKQGTIYRSFSFKNKILLYILVYGVSIVSMRIFQFLPNTNLPVINGLLFGISLFAIFLIIFGYIDGIQINLINCILSLGLYIYIVVFQDPSDAHYIVISTYTLIMEFMCYLTWVKLYKEQTKIRGGKPLKDFEKTTLEVSKN